MPRVSVSAAARAVYGDMRMGRGRSEKWQGPNSRLKDIGALRMRPRPIDRHFPRLGQFFHSSSWKVDAKVGFYEDLFVKPL